MQYGVIFACWTSLVCAVLTGRGRCDVCRADEWLGNAAYQRQDDCAHDFNNKYSKYISEAATQVKGSSRTVTDAEITEIVKEMWSGENREPSEGLTLDYQGSTTTRDPIDRSPRPLFTHVDESIFGKLTFSLFLKLLDNYNPSIYVKEELNSIEVDEIDAFIDAVVDSKPMSVLRIYFIGRGLIEHSISDFKNLLRSLWFEPYRRRSRGPISSSGFEHVMVGELKRGKVTGFHNWIKFYQEEKKGDLNYMGFLSEPEPAVLKMKFTWKGEKKPISSMFVGVSPEFEMAVYTLCIMLKPNRKCHFEFMGRTIRVQTFDMSKVPGLQVGSAYII